MIKIHYNRADNLLALDTMLQHDFTYISLVTIHGQHIVTYYTNNKIDNVLSIHGDDKYTISKDEFIKTFEQLYCDKDYNVITIQNNNEYIVITD